MVNVSADCILQIRDTYKKSAIIATYTTDTEHFKVVYNGNGSNHMNINLVGLKESFFKAGDEIAAFDDDICVGAVKLNETNLMNDAVGINASVSDADAENGFTVGHSIELRAKSFLSGKEFQVFPKDIDGEMIFQPKSSVFLLLQDQLTGKSGIEYIDINIYPNPASEIVTVKLSNLPLEETRIVLLDITGMQLQNRIVQSTQETFEIQSYPSGIYLIKTIIGKNSTVKKIIKE